MLDHAAEATDMARGRTRADLDTDRGFNLSVTRLLEIIGEAAARVSPTVRQRHSEIPWSQIVGLRNRLIHAYDEVDFDILWNILIDDLPPLIESLQNLLDDDPS
jgi:uncharacterized protein with HEPN domain